MLVGTSSWRSQLWRTSLAHLDHPYKGVREAMGQTLATIYRTRYHESYPDLKHLLEAQKSASSVGTYPYLPTEEFSEMVRGVFAQIEEWRKARTPGQQTPSSYTSGSKTVLLWLDSTLSSHECTQLVPFFPDVFHRATPAHDGRKGRSGAPIPRIPRFPPSPQHPIPRREEALTSSNPSSASDKHPPHGTSVSAS